MKLMTRDYDQVTVVELPEKLVMANTAECRGALKSMVERADGHFILDLSGVNFVDSSGLSVLISTLKAAKAINREVLLLKPTANVRSLIELTRLHQVFEIFADDEAAIRRLQGQSDHAVA